ncbi:hypothetical protein A9G30_08120 [Gilliamella sp. Fer4-1]|nr:hypothetical protein A9G30_08120 [Gilliamella apicola]
MFTINELIIFPRSASRKKTQQTGTDYCYDCTNRIEAIAIKDTEKSCYTMMRQPISRIESLFLKKEVDANYG